jgi:hypothetical protein
MAKISDQHLTSYSAMSIFPFLLESPSKFVLTRNLQGGYHVNYLFDM